MIDFIKLNISYLSDKERKSIITNPEFNCKQTFDVITGELEYPIKGVYKDTINIIINTKRMELNGSLHQLHNVLTKGEKQNFDDLSINDTIGTVFHLKEKFNLQLKIIKIENLEFGPNIKCSISPEEILRKKTIVWDGEMPSKNFKYSNKGKYLEFERTQYSLKIYDKGKQNTLPYHLMRIEYKAKCNQSVRKLGFRVLSDLLDVSKYDDAIQLLKNTFDKTIIVDSIDSKRIDLYKDRMNFEKAINPITWANLDNTDKDRKAKERLRNNLLEIIEKYGLNTIKKELVFNLNEKVNELKKCHNFHDFSNIELPDKCHNFHNFSNIELHRKGQSSSMSQFIHNIYLKNVTYCKITGIDISNQKENKNYIVGTTIRELKEKDFKTFEKLLRRYKTKNWVNFTIDRMIKEIAHRVRRNYQTLFEKKEIYKNSLFPI